MTEPTITLKLTADQLRALEYIVSDWRGSVDTTDVDDDPAGQDALIAANGLQQAVGDALPKSDDAYVQNVQVEVMYETFDQGADLTPEEAVRVMSAAGVPVKSKLAIKTEFDGSYLVDVDAAWYTQLGDGGSFQGSAEGYDVDITHE